ncbi:helix-turn-helix domain-containing protein [Nostoc favosum]|uniref:Helix-turn-helix domain-containing protein n=1 Tax=Nostoc favosum CHAB5714 TaxID=2780399 RepID=A0ABS8I9B1_9NOSO|nr:helix-turn-helix domain-containing protein [Nostoc favosum]MCC5600773.1 helix-turn-helix domain-containing protein [Nostoc favosum CHAB5714]
MQGRISSIRVEMTGEQQDVLNSWLRKSTTPLGLAKRARAILMLASGESFSKTSQYVDIGERHLRKWARRFIDQGIEGLYDTKRPGRPPVFSPSSRIVSSKNCL